MKEMITVTGISNRSRKNRPLAFKNKALLISCIWKINNALIENAVDIDAAKPMYNLTGYSKNHIKEKGSLWNH